MRLCPKGDAESSTPHETDQEDFEGNALICNDCKEAELEEEVRTIEAFNVLLGLNRVTRSDFFVEPFNPFEQ